MSLRRIIAAAAVGCLSLFVAIDVIQAGGRGGRGGSRGGGIPSSPSISQPKTRPSTPSYSRPSSPSVAQPATRPSTPSTSQPATRPSAPAVSTQPAPQPATRPATQPAYGSTQRPSNSGSLLNSGTTTSRGTYQYPTQQPGRGESGSWTTQRGSEVHWATGSEGGRGVVVEGAGGVTRGAVQGPGGGTAAGVSGPEGRAAAGYRGPAGGSGGAVRGPEGGSAGYVRGPAGGGAGYVRGPEGGGAAYARGPGGQAAAAVRGPEGYYVAGTRGPHGNEVFTNLPPGAVHYTAGGCYYHGYYWYSPYWHDDDCYYEWVYPPVGFYYVSLPPQHTTIIISKTTYYVSDGVYYAEGERNGQKGFVVVEIPQEVQTPNPREVLKSMIDYLGMLPYAGVMAEVVTEEVLPSGTKIQVASQRLLTLSRPDKFVATVKSDGEEKVYLYDGKQMVLFHRQKNVYGVLEAPGTIDATLEKVAQDYNVSAPLMELFNKGIYPKLAALLKSADYVGLSQLGGTECHHLAFTQDAIDWEIWIQTGDRPLPRRLTVTYRLLPGAPRFSADLTLWDLSTKPAAEVFRFEPSAGAAKVPLTPEMIQPQTAGQ